MMSLKEDSSLTNRLCLVCGDVANGVHYNVLSCEGCKSFFLRSIKSGSRFNCTQGGQCNMDLYTRRHCPACRLSKCRSLGMTEERVWDRSRLCTRKVLQRKESKSKRRKQTVVHEKKRTEKLQIQSPTDAQMELVTILENAYQTSKTVCREYLTPAPKSEDGRLNTVIYQSSHCSGTKVDSTVTRDDNIQSSSSSTSPGSIEICPELRKYAMDAFAVSVRQTIHFARAIPQFCQLSSDDQAALVRSGIIDSLLLRLSEFFIVEKNTILNDLGDEYDLKMMSILGLPNFSEPSFQFLKQVKAMQLTTAEYALLNAASLLAPDRDELKNRERVEEIQFPIIMALHAVTKHTHPSQPMMFANLMMKLATMREITLIHQQDIMKMKLLKQDFTPLVAELFNL